MKLWRDPEELPPLGGWKLPALPEREPEAVRAALRARDRAAEEAQRALREPRMKRATRAPWTR
jgi:hypothetical protein